MPSAVRFRELDRTDETQTHLYWVLGKACTVELPYDVWPAWEPARRTWAAPDPEREIVFLGAFEGAEMIGGAWIGLPLLDNTHLAHFELYVAPGARRRGIGTTLLEAVEATAARHGRSTYVCDTTVPVGGDSPGLGFAAARGYARASTEECKVVALAEHEDALPALLASALDRAAGYTLVTWGDAVPEEWMGDVCVLYSSFMGEIPLEELDLQPQTWTPQRVRDAEARRVASGSQHLTVAAVAPDGHLAGYTDLGVWLADPARASIHSTLVAPAHRGHRLGLALKARLHQLTREQFPAVETIVTYNAGVNAHMNAVNEALGYRVVQHSVDLQKRV